MLSKLWWCIGNIKTSILILNLVCFVLYILYEKNDNHDKKTPIGSKIKAYPLDIKEVLSEKSVAIFDDYKFKDCYSYYSLVD